MHVYVHITTGCAATKPLSVAHSRDSPETPHFVRNRKNANKLPKQTHFVLSIGVYPHKPFGQGSTDSCVPPNNHFLFKYYSRLVMLSTLNATVEALWSVAESDGCSRPSAPSTISVPLNPTTKR